MKVTVGLIGRRKEFATSPRGGLGPLYAKSPDAIVRGAHPSRIAKGRAASVVVAQRWASPLKRVDGTGEPASPHVIAPDAGKLMQ
jgi:hypothetical protein